MGVNPLAALVAAPWCGYTARMTSQWLAPQVTPAFLRKLAVRRDEAVLRDARDRAGLLMRLGRSEEDAVRRLSANLAWEAGTAKPRGTLAADVEKTVRAVYARR